jgi:hypothetical protein
MNFDSEKRDGQPQMVMITTALVRRANFNILTGPKALPERKCMAD